ncbi:ERF family protein [Ottowia sp. VDI28]|uniref:ERF family protein n=1 Tax=Ottowia sp. VDI28 TaxID=3133968 RepID=UPI003C30E860
MSAVLEERPQTTLPAVHAETSALIQAIIGAAHDPTVDIGKMERLLDMHERISSRDAEQHFNAAMVAAQAGMGRIAADSTNPQTRSQYASYAQLDRHLRPIYTAHGFSLSFDEGEGAPENYVRVLCYVSHAAGHTRTYHCDIPADGKGAKGGDVMTKTHAVGSGKSYGKRYLLKDIFNVAVGEDDDDGNGAAGVHPQAAEVLDAFNKLMKRIPSAATDAAALGLWREGANILGEFEDHRNLYDKFKDAVALRRMELKR